MEINSTAFLLVSNPSAIGSSKVDLGKVGDLTNSSWTTGLTNFRSYYLNSQMHKVLIWFAWFKLSVFFLT